MKQWHKQVLKLGLPVLFDWIKSLFSNEKREIDRVIAQMQKEADIALVVKNYKLHNEINETIKKLRGK